MPNITKEAYDELVNEVQYWKDRYADLSQAYSHDAEERQRFDDTLDKIGQTANGLESSPPWSPVFGSEDPRLAYREMPFDERQERTIERLQARVIALERRNAGVVALASFARTAAWRGQNINLARGSINVSDR